MRRQNLFLYADMSDMSKVFSPNNTKAEMTVLDGAKWLKSTIVTVGDNYTQYTVKKDVSFPSGSYHVSAIAKADGGTGSVRIFLHIGDKYLIPCQTSLDNGKTTVCNMSMTVPDDCTEILVRIVSKGGVGASAMIRDISIEPTNTYALALRGGLPSFFVKDTAPY